MSRDTVYMLLACMGWMILSQMGGIQIQQGSVEPLRIQVAQGVPGDSLDVSAGRDVFVLSI